MKKSFLKKLKQAAAAVLSAAMVAGGVQGFGYGVNNVQAATELQPNTKLQSANDNTHIGVSAGGYSFGRSDSTAYVFGDATNHIGSNNWHLPTNKQLKPQYAFNFAAIVDEAHMANNTQGYSSSATTDDGGNPIVQTAYSNGSAKNWWLTYYAFGKPNKVGNLDDSPETLDASGAVDPVVTAYASNGIEEQTATFNSNNESKLKTFNLKTGGVKKNGDVTEVSEGNQKVEVRQELKSSDDGKWLIIEYTVYNTKDSQTYFMIGNHTDTQVYNHDGCPTIVTTQGVHGSTFEGLHMIANYMPNGSNPDAADRKYRFSNLDILTYLPGSDLDIGIKRRPGDSNDKSELRVWAGKYHDTAGINHTRWVFSKSKRGFKGSPKNSARSFDSSAAFSAYFDLKGHETKTARFAVSMKPSVYYVKQGAANGDGFIASPYGSVKQAVDAIAATKVKKAYIYLMSDVDISETINIPTGVNITFETTDFTIDDNANYNVNQANGYYYQNAPNPYPGEANRKIIKRGGDFKGALFNVTGDKTGLTIGDVTVDGGKENGKEAEAALITANNGTVALRRKAVLQNNKVTTADKASAIDLSGSANLDMNYGTIKDNISKNNSAVKYSSSGKFTVGSTVTIQDNKDDGGTAANVFLDTGKVITATKDLGESKIGVNVKQLPNDNNHGTAVAEYPSSLGLMPYSALNFPADKKGNSVSAGDVSKQVTGGSNPQEASKIYLGAAFFSLSIFYLDQDGNNMPSLNSTNESLAAGTPINKSFTSVSGYTFKEYKVGNGAGTATLNYEGLTGSNGSISGGMPDKNTNISVIYQKEQVTYYFDKNFGPEINRLLPVLHEPVKALGGSVLGSLPTTTRPGYDFEGWFPFTDANNNHLLDSGEEDAGGTKLQSYPNPTSAFTKHYYAKWTPGAAGYPVVITHKNVNPALEINFGGMTKNYQIDAPVSENSVAIPGYRFNQGRSTVSPTGQGSIDAAGHYTLAHMIASGINLNFRYNVDNGHPGFRFTVKHQAGGIDIIPPVDTMKKPEMPITAEKSASLVQTGYIYSGFSITEGAASRPNDYVVGLLDTPGLVVLNDVVDGKFSGYMPNQNVTIIFNYNSLSQPSLMRKFNDRINNKTLLSRVDVKTGSINEPIPNDKQLYGYKWDSDSTALISPTGTAAVDQTTGTLTGSMPPSNQNLRVDYKLSRDSSKWRNIRFEVIAPPKGSLVAKPNAPTSFLADDGTPAGREMAYNFAKLVSEGYIPDTVPESQYYMFEGWYLDSAGINRVESGTTFPTSSADLVLYAKFVEDPSKWVDIHFDKGEHVTSVSPTSAHAHYDATLAQALADNYVNVVYEVNYIHKSWTINGTNVDNSTPLVNGATYIVHGRKDPNIWGLNIGDFNASGHIGPDGSGQIRVRETQAGHVYIVSDDFGNVVAVKTAPDNEVLLFDDLYPGTKYHVQEAAPGTVVTVGQPMPAPIPGVISDPKPVIIPTLEDNYNVGFDPKHEDKAQITVNPADPDSDYALIDENGNVVQYPGSDNGWKTPVGRGPSTVTFDNLDPGKTYTVVARKKGDSRVPDPLSKKEYGTDVVANPGDMVDAKKFIVEVRPENASEVKIVTVAGTDPSQHETGSSNWKVTDAKEKDEVVIHADPVNSAGKRFLYWVVVAGRSKGVSGRIKANDFTFSMSANNIVLRAVYERFGPAEGNYNAIVEEEIRGGAVGEYGIEPEHIARLEEELTTDKDRELIGTNKADVRYKIIFNKRRVKVPERAAVKEASIAGQLHPTAFNAAWALDIEAERYVDGRLVGRATDSNAEVPVLIQLPNEDTDMMDYELFDVTDTAISPVPKMIDFTDPENTAGYCKFTGRVKGKYVLVYSKTFKLRFFDTIQALDFEDLNNPLRNFYHRLRVRRGEHPDDVWYNTTVDYQIITDYQNGNSTPPIKTPLFDIYGVEYIFKNAWSKKQNIVDINAADFEKPQNKFLMTDAVTRSMSIFAYYTNDRPRKEKAWNELDSLRIHAQDIVRSPYLKQDEITRLEAAIARAIARLKQKRGELLNLALFGGSGEVDAGRMANYYELQAELDNLGRIIREYEELINRRNNNFIGRTGGSSGGGSGSAGKGIGSVARPFEHVGERTFMLGVDGNWKINDSTGRWSFVLNGGLPLNNTWGKIQYSDEKTNKLLTKWYFFDSQASMVQGWYHDAGADKWYFLNPEQGADAGQMIMGWYKDAAGFWYYLDPVVGEMYTGWCRIGEHWYYFSPVSVEGHPKGSLYVSTMTPDGYKVNHNGEWVQ